MDKGKANDKESMLYKIGTTQWTLETFSRNARET